MKHAVYIALGIDMARREDALGMHAGENGSAKFWLSIMNGLKNRGVGDILVACVDGLSGFLQEFVSYKDINGLMADLRRVYAPQPGKLPWRNRGCSGEMGC